MERIVGVRTQHKAFLSKDWLSPVTSHMQ